MKAIHSRLRFLLYFILPQTLRLEYRFCMTRLITYLHEPSRPSSDFRGVLLGMHTFYQPIHLENTRQADWLLLSLYRPLPGTIALVHCSKLPAPPRISPLLQHLFVPIVYQHSTPFPAQALFGVQLSGALFQIVKP